MVVTYIGSDICGIFLILLSLLQHWTQSLALAGKRSLDLSFTPDQFWFLTSCY